MDHSQEVSGPFFKPYCEPSHVSEFTEKQSPLPIAYAFKYL